MNSVFRLLPLAVCVGALVLTGCRTYGNDEHENGPKMYDAMQETITQLEQEYGRAQSDLRRLESAAEDVEALQPLAERYRSYVESHEAALAGHREQAEQLSPEAAYRTLHRTYGALVTDRRLLKRQYQRTIRKVWATVRDTTIPRTPTRDPSRYVITPVQYPEGEQKSALTMTEALRAAEETPGIQSEEQLGGSE